MSNSITSVLVQQTAAPAPITLQKTGAMISQGATNLAPGAKGLLTQLSDLTPLLAPAVTLLSLTQSAGVATATLEGGASDITSGVCNAATGLVTLTLTAGIGVGPGDAVAISSATGTGSFASIDGTWQAAAGSTGTTLTFFVPAGLTMTITGGEATASLGLANTKTFLVTITGAGVVAYNGTFLATVTSATTFTYAIPSGTASPATGAPTATPPNQVELLAEATTFFAQSAGQSVYVLEVGPGTDVAGIAYLAAWITANPPTFYAYLVPRNWANEATFVTLMASFEALTAATYFFVTMTLANYGSFTKLMKCVIGMIEAPTIAATEFSLASAFFVWLNYSPSPTNQLTPFPFSFLFGVTAYPSIGNAALLATLKAANVNLVQPGAEGGISNTILKWGVTMDGNQATYWYDVDWAQMQGSQAVSNAVINGSNSQPPLLYNQQGINTLQSVLAGTLARGVASGVILGQVLQTELAPSVFATNVQNGLYTGYTVVNAVPFTIYNALNPSDYQNGKYGGLQVAMTPQLSFTAIIIDMDVVNFA